MGARDLAYLFIVDGKPSGLVYGETLEMAVDLAEKNYPEAKEITLTPYTNQPIRWHPHYIKGVLQNPR